MSTEEEQLAALCRQLTPELMDMLIGNGTSPNELFMHYWWCSTENFIHWSVKTFTTPIFIIVGSMGNVLAFVVLMRKMLQQWSVCFYLALYALINTIVLYVGCGLDWVSYITQTRHIANQADWVCRLWKFVFNVINYSSGWVVVAMTVDRFVHMWYPRRAHQLCTVFMAKLVTVFVLIGLVVISIHAMWTYALTPHGCIIEATKDTHAFQTIAWPMVSAIFYSYLPVLIILTLDIFLILGLLHPNADSRGDSNPLQHSLTTCVLSVSLTFLALYLPTVIVNIFMYSLAEFSANIQLRARLFLLQELCQSLACLNNAISFVIYFTRLPIVRQELLAMLGSLRRHSGSSTVQELHSVDTNGGLVSGKQETCATLL